MILIKLNLGRILLIVLQIFMDLQELCVCKENSGNSKLCNGIEMFLTSHSLNQKEQETMAKFLKSLIKVKMVSIFNTFVWLHPLHIIV